MELHQTLIDGLKSSPALLTCVIIVYMFIRHMASQSKLNSELIKEMHGDHMAARQRNHEVVDKAAVTNMQLVGILGELKGAIHDMTLRSVGK